MSTQLPLFPLRSVLFPGGPLPLRIFERRYVDLVSRCMREATTFGVVLIREGSEIASQTAAPADANELLTADIGTDAQIVDFHQLPDGLLGIVCRGGRRFRLHERRRQPDGLYLGDIEWLEESPSRLLPTRHQPLAQLLERVLAELEPLYATVEKQLDDAGWLVCRLAEILPLGADDTRTLLEIDDPIAQLDRLSPFIERPSEGFRAIVGRTIAQGSLRACTRWLRQSSALQAMPSPKTGSACGTRQRVHARIDPVSSARDDCRKQSHGGLRASSAALRLHAHDPRRVGV